MNVTLAVITFILYSIAGALLARRLAKGARANTASKLAPIGLGLLAVAVHTGVTHQAIFAGEGLNLAFFNVLSLITDVVALLLLLSALARPLENLGIIVLPLAGVAALLQLAAPAGSGDVMAPGLRSHIVLSLLAYSLFILATVQAVLLAVQDRHLRNRHPGGFIRALPPLETMEGLLFQFIGIGYALLGFSLVTGALFIDDMFAQRVVHHTVLSLIAWVVFSVLLWGRWRFGWRGRTAIRWTLSGAGVLALAYLGSKLVLELIIDA